MQKIELIDFLKEYFPQIKEKITQNTKLIWSGRTYRKYYADLPKEPFTAQEKAIGQVVDGLQKLNTVFLSGEMGVGKTLISLYALYTLYQLKGKLRALILVPNSLIERPWLKEIEECLKDKAKVLIAEKPSDLLNLPKERNFELVLATETHWKGTFEKTEEDVFFKQGNEIYFKCPQCCSKFTKTPQNTIKKLNIKFQKDTGSWIRQNLIINTNIKICPRCGYSIINYKPQENRNIYPLANIFKKVRNKFDLVVIDEGSNYKNESKRGLTLGKIRKKTLVLTGTIVDGYPDSIFLINMQLNGGFWRERGYTFKSKTKFVKDFGYLKYEIKVDNKGKAKEILLKNPGISPELAMLMRQNTIFLALEDIEQDLPPKEEIFVEVKMDNELKKYYTELKEKLRQHYNLMQATSTLLAGIDLAGQDHDFGSFHMKGTGTILPKEKKLVEILKEEISLNRKSLIYVLYTQKRDISERLLKILKQYGIKATILKQNTVAPEKREEYLEEIAQKVDAVIVNPRLVEKGLNLQSYTNIIWFQPTYVPDLFKQASRRSYRIDQKEKVKIYQMFYTKTIQEKAFQLINQKDVISDMFNGIINYQKLDFAYATKNAILAELAKELQEEIT